MEHLQDVLIPCPVCGGTPLDHGPHDWRFDKWSLTEPVVWRCHECNAVVQFVTRERFRTTPSSALGVGHNIVRNQLIPQGRVTISSCDVCGGAGVVPLRDETESNRVGTLIAARAAWNLGHVRLPLSPWIRERDIAVLSVCPRCGRSDRSVPVVSTIGTDEDLRPRSFWGEVVIDGCTGEAAHYCGRCDLAFGDAAEELMAGLR